MPILSNWGIPISILSFVGNFIFSPILTVFLFISSLIFVTEILSIPNRFLIHALTLTSSFWENLLSLGKKTWLIGFEQPGTTLKILIIILFFLLFFKFVFKILSKIILISILVISAFVLVEYNRQNRWPDQKQSAFYPRSNKRLKVSQMPNKTIQIVDYGFLNRKKSPEKFVEFELKPYLIKKYGIKTIEKIKLNRPTTRNIRAIKELSKTFTVQLVQTDSHDIFLTKTENL